MCVNRTRISSSADSEHSAHSRHSHAEFIVSDETKKKKIIYETICWLLAHCIIPHIREEWHAILGSHFPWCRKYFFSRQTYIRNLHDLRNCSLVLGSLSGLAVGSNHIFRNSVYHIIDAKYRKGSCRQSDRQSALNLVYFFFLLLYWDFEAIWLQSRIQAKTENMKHKCAIRTRELCKKVTEGK